MQTDRISFKIAFGYLSRQLANDMSDKGMILGAVHRSPGICFMAEENPRNLS